MAEKYTEVLKNAELYKQLGQIEHSLGSPDYPRDETTIYDYPWDHVTFCTHGGGHRLDIDTTVTFRAHVDGLIFRWYLDIEEADANGQGHYQLKSERVLQILSLLKDPTVREQFADYLEDCSRAVTNKAEEHFKWVSRMYGDAAIFAHCAKVARSG